MTGIVTRDMFESEARRLRPTLMRVAISIIGNSEDASDIVQETLLKLWFLRDKLGEYSSIDAPARVIARNLSINFVRRSRVVCDDLEKYGDIRAEETDCEVSEALMAAIASLPDTEQAVLRLKHIEGMETEEIAALIQSTPGAVRTALSRARKKIREMFNCNHSLSNERSNCKYR